MQNVLRPVNKLSLSFSSRILSVHYTYSQYRRRRFAVILTFCWRLQIGIAIAQTPTTVYTCKYTPVLAYIRPGCRNRKKRGYQQVAQQYPNASAISAFQNT